jgi:hypothetical protein
MPNASTGSLFEGGGRMVRNLNIDYINIMPKSVSPGKTEDNSATTSKAKFFYVGAYELGRHKPNTSQAQSQSPTKSTSQEKKGYKK